jgi:hypothetical protein
MADKRNGLVARYVVLREEAYDVLQDKRQSAAPRRSETRELNT